MIFLYCSKCGKENSDNVNFCIYCGNKLKNGHENGHETTVLSQNAIKNNISQPAIQQQITNVEKEKINKKVVRKVIVVIVVILLISVLALIIGNSHSTENIDYLYNESENYTSKINFDYDTGYTLSDDLYDYQIKVGNIVYQFPMSYDEFMNTGLEYSPYEDSNEKISSGYSDLVNFSYADGSIILAELVNFSNSETIHKNCHITGMRVFANNGNLMFDPSNISLAKGIVLNVSNRDDVEKAYGKPSDISETEDNNIVYYSYTEDFYRQIRLGFENDILTYIEIENVVEPENVVDLGISDEVPQLVENYIQPDSLGLDVASGNFELENILYKLPLPLSELLDNGWEVVEKDADTISGKGHAVVSIRKDNVEINNLYLNNYEEYEISMENGIIEKISSTSFTYGKSGNLIFPGEISEGMSEDDFINVIKNYDYEKEITDYDVRYYINEDGIDFYVYVSDGKIESLALNWKGE